MRTEPEEIESLKRRLTVACADRDNMAMYIMRLESRVRELEELNRELQSDLDRIFSQEHRWR